MATLRLRALKGHCACINNGVTATAPSPSGHFHLIIYDPQFQSNTDAEPSIGEGLDLEPIRTFRTTNCVVSRLASAQRRLIMEYMIFIQCQAGVTLCKALIALCENGNTSWHYDRSLAAEGRTSRPSDRQRRRGYALNPMLPGIWT